MTTSLKISAASITATTWNVVRSSSRVTHGNRYSFNVLRSRCHDNSPGIVGTREQPVVSEVMPRLPCGLISISVSSTLCAIHRQHYGASQSQPLHTLPVVLTNCHVSTAKHRSTFIPKPLHSSFHRSMTTLKKLGSENIWTIPNYLCVGRMAMAPILGYLVVNSQFPYAIGLLAVAGLTDLLDGWIARTVPGQSSILGSFLDPMADKVLVGTLFLSLTYINLIPISLTLLVLSRDAFLIAAGFYIRFQSLQKPRTFGRYFDITSPSAQLAPTLISKVNTGVQLSLIGATLLSTVLPVFDSYLVYIWYCTGGSTILSALSYVFAKETYKVIQKTPVSHSSQLGKEEKKGQGT